MKALTYKRLLSICYMKHVILSVEVYGNSVKGYGSGKVETEFCTHMKVDNCVVLIHVQKWNCCH